MNTSLLAFAVGLIASLGLTVPVRQLALRVGMVDHPGPRKVHVQPMPLLGGLAIYSGVLIALLVSMDGPALRQVIGIYLGATSSRWSESWTTAACCIIRSNCSAPCLPRR